MKKRDSLYYKLLRHKLEIINLNVRKTIINVFLTSSCKIVNNRSLS